VRGDQHTLPRSTWALLIALTLGWGCNWPMMKLALAEVPVWTFRGLCVAAGALGMFAIARANRRRILPEPGQWRGLTATAVFNVTLWNVCIAYGLTFLPAGRSVILAYSMPLWVVLLSRLLLGERLTPRRLLGVILGMAGLALLIGGEFSALRAAPTGALLIIAAALAWATGTVLMKRYPSNLPITAFTAWQFLIGGTPIILGALLLDHAHWHPISWTAAAAVLYNMVVAFVLCHWAWFKIVSRASAGVSALGTLMIPVVGVSSSLLVLGEHASWQEWAALLLVLGAVATVLIPRPAQAVAGD